MSDGRLESTPPILTLDAGGEYAAGATVLAAYWPKDFPHRVMLRTRPTGRTDLLIPVHPAAFEKAQAILTEWSEMRTGVSASARLLRQRIRTEASGKFCSALG